MNTPLQACNPLSLGVNLDPQLIQINVSPEGSVLSGVGSTVIMSNWSKKA